jgi:predicted secreted protein
MLYWVFPHTLAGVFPKVRMYEFSDYMGFCLASNDPFAENDQRASVLFAKYPPDMQEEVLEIANYLGDESYIRTHNAGCPASRDWNPVMEYYIWREFQRNSWAKRADGQALAIEGAAATAGN